MYRCQARLGDNLFAPSTSAFIHLEVYGEFGDMKEMEGRDRGEDREREREGTEIS